MMLKKMSFHHDPLPEKTETEVHETLRDDNEEDEDEELETLSFCEFSIHGSDSDLWGNSSTETSSSSSQNSSFKSSTSQQEEEEDCFEFFSQEWCRGDDQNFKNIIFCGKLIPYKEPASENVAQKPPVDHHGIKLRKHKKARRSGGVFRWKWNFFSSLSRKTKRQVRNSSETDGHDQYKTLKTEVVTETEPKQRRSRTAGKKQSKISSLLTSSSSSVALSPSKWYLFFFGITKYRTKMELKDIRIRQSRTRRTSSFNNDDKSVAGAVCKNLNESSKGIWAVLRALSCGTSCDHRSSGTDVMLRPQSDLTAGRLQY